MEWRFNAPPGWPSPPPGWTPPQGWSPDPSWPQAPADWQYWVEDARSTAPAVPPPQPRRSRIGWVVAIVALVLLALVALAAVAVLAGVRSVGGAGTQTKRLETTTQASSVQIGNDCGQVTVREGSQGVVRTEARITTLWRTPTVTSREVGDSVVVDVQCPPFSGGVRLAVEVPPAAAIQARSSAGGVQVDGVSGPLTLESSAGSVQGEDLASAQVQAQSSAGSVTLRWSDDADPQSIDATSSAGSVTVQLPDNPSTAYRVDADSSAGSTQVEVRTDPSATRTVRAQSSAGSVLVTYR